jgi:two-component system LytT family response regulator
LDEPDDNADETPSAPREPCAPGQRFLVKREQRQIVIEAAAVDWLESAGNYVRLHVAGRAYVIRASLSDLAARLDANKFERIHRSTIVNMTSVAAMAPAFNGDYVLFLRDGTQLKLSRTYRRAVLARQFLNGA